ncbi:MAG: hypothetical protein LBN95_04245, partial [Prevotellaceae bacterium]|nr:hypothetical protein [Prevotellaceae bacterium]
MEDKKLTEQELEQIANGVILVKSNAMNRAALGIVAAYFKLHPNATFEELKEALPDSLNPSGPIMPKTIFKPFTERDFGVAHS